MPDLTGLSLGRYQLLEKLGKGGMAGMYKAYDTRLKMYVVERDSELRSLSLRGHETQDEGDLAMETPKPEQKPTSVKEPGPEPVQVPPPPKQKKKIWRWGIGLIVLIGLIWIAYGLSSGASGGEPASCEEYMDSRGVSMCLVPAGKFTMGSDEDISDDDEKPMHEVYLDAFYMDKYEVTNALYEACVSAGVCNPPQESSSPTRSSYYGNPQYDDHPVIKMDWISANTYCKWRGVRLPTEAEWEKAARGTDGRNFPWGRSKGCTYANYETAPDKGCVGDTAKVGSYPSGVSPYGIFDLSGNVWEWVADKYSRYYYPGSTSSNPMGPSSGDYRVLRGGSWNDEAYNIRTSRRYWFFPDGWLDDFGFRCARSLVTEAPIMTEVFHPAEVPIVTEAPLVAKTPVVPEMREEITDAKGVVMRLVPAGEFTMGSDVYDDEKPVHQVYLDAYYMDKYEVTNALYKVCVSAGVCDPPRETISFKPSNYYPGSQYADYPVVNVDWISANTYCEWRGARLPTEAEWEKAARGTDGRTYPWGNNNPDSSLLKYDGGVAKINQGVIDTTEVGQYPAGVSPYGIFDMAGNVMEWVADWYSDTYYSSSPYENPPGPLSGVHHILRGGSFVSNRGGVRSSNRVDTRPIDPGWGTYGFRCALGTSP